MEGYQKTRITATNSSSPIMKQDGYWTRTDQEKAEYLQNISSGSSLLIEDGPWIGRSRF